MWYFKLICVIYMSVEVSSEDVAGLNTTTRRIFTGSPVKITEAPFMAILLRNDFLACGASVVHKQFLVSAAHCFTPAEYSVKVGTDTLRDGEIYDITAVFIHPLYSEDPIIDRLYYDVCVIKLIVDLEFSDRVRIINLAPEGLKIQTGTLMKTYGFGQTENEPYSKVLRGAQVQYLDPGVCTRLSKLTVYPEEICAGGAPGEGDSGGPLAYNEMLVGIVSCGPVTGGRLPQIYSRVSALRDFFTHIIESKA